jgi:carboxypeptidase D
MSCLPPAFATVELCANPGQIYIAGESYAGQHIPHISRAVLDRNKRVDSTRQWNLKGALIGNGWISGVHQYPAYLQYAYQEGLLKAGTAESTSVERKQARCMIELSNGGKDHVDVSTCEGILGELLAVTSEVKGDERYCYNMYDVRLRDTHPDCGMNWPPDLETVKPYLRTPEVVRALHVNPAKKTGWQECNGAVGAAFRATKSVPSYKLLPDLLKEMKIVLFSGDRDLICNHIGTEALIDDLEYNGGKGFRTSPGVIAPRRKWTFEGEAAGFYQEARNLTYIKFFNSSHMVPFDYPRRTRDMLDRFRGVDIARIGGMPASSKIDGEEGPQTSVGGHTNSTAAEEEAIKQLKEAEWKAYYKSGEVALVVVAIAAFVWGFFIWRGRRRRAGYSGVYGADPDDGRGPAAIALGGMGLEGFRQKRSRGPGDLEAADFDENELDDLAEGSSPVDDREKEMNRDRYAIGEDDESDDEGKLMNGHSEK